MLTSVRRASASTAGWIAGNLAELVACAGGYLVSTGVSAVNAAAGEITSGVLLVGGAVRPALSRGW